MRARALKDTLQFLGEHRPGLASTMEVDAPPEALCSIREALPMEWIPASLSRGLIEVVVAELGEARAPEVWRDLVNFTMRHSPVIGPLISVATTVGLAAPWSFAKQIPRGWENTYRGYGVPSVVRDGDAAAVVDWDEVPDYLFEHPVHYVAIEGGLMGVVELSARPCSASLELDRASSRVQARLRWG